MNAAQYAYLNARISLYAAQLLDTDGLDAFIDRPYDEYARDGDQPRAAEGDADDLDQNNVTILLRELAAAAQSGS